MQFHYLASQPNGKITEGDTEAQGLAEVLEYLGTQGLKPISVKVVKKGLTKGLTKGLFSSPISLIDKIFLTKYLSLMLKVGTDLFRAIDILIVDFKKPAVKSLLIEIRSALEKGQPFYTTFAKHPREFSSVFTNLIKAGEASGNLDTVFEDLSNSLSRQQELHSRIRSALVYPILLLVVSVLVLLLLVTFALPRIAGVFLESGINPPLFSRIVFSIGLFIGHNIYFILIFLLVLAAGLGIFFAKTKTGRRAFSHFIHRVPVLSKVLRQIALQRFAATFSSLLKSGLSMIESLEITAEAVGNEEIQKALLKISREGVSKGVSVGAAFKKETVFPNVVVNLVSVGETAGHLEDILNTLADFYELEIDTSIKTLVSFLEPILLGFIGIIIGGIALSIIVPIYQLVGQF